MKLRFLMVISVLFCFGRSQAPVVSSIVIKGNKVTMDYVIKREIQYSVGMPLDSALARDDRNRIFNLGIFADVYWQAIPLEDRTVILEYEVVESKRIFGGPAPAWDEKTGWSLAGGLVWKNFRGRNETLMGSGSIGGKTTFGIYYLNPWISGDHVSLNIETGHNIEDHSFLPYKVNTTSFEGNVGRYFGYTRKVSLGFELVQKYFLVDSIELKYKFIAPQGVFQYDSRDIYLEPTKGILITQSFYSILDLDRKRKTTTFWQHSYSAYRKLNHSQKPLVLALNLTSRITLGQLDPVWMNYIGSTATVRGWNFPGRKLYTSSEQSNRFGQQYVIVSAELRKTIIPRYVTKFETEFGLTVAWFIDAGVISQELPELRKQIPIQGTGISLQIPFPYIGILRLDYGWGLHQGKIMDQAFHFDFQQKF